MLTARHLVLIVSLACSVAMPALGQKANTWQMLSVLGTYVDNRGENPEIKKRTINLYLNGDTGEGRACIAPKGGCVQFSVSIGDGAATPGKYRLVGLAGLDDFYGAKFAVLDTTSGKSASCVAPVGIQRPGTVKCTGAG